MLKPSKWTDTNVTILFYSAFNFNVHLSIDTVFTLSSQITSNEMNQNISKLSNLNSSLWLYFTNHRI